MYKNLCIHVIGPSRQLVLFLFFVMSAASESGSWVVILRLILYGQLIWEANMCDKSNRKIRKDAKFSREVDYNTCTKHRNESMYFTITWKLKFFSYQSDSKSIGWSVKRVCRNKYNFVFISTFFCLNNFIDHLSQLHRMLNWIHLNSSRLLEQKQLL